VFNEQTNAPLIDSLLCCSLFIAPTCCIILRELSLGAC